MRRILDPSPGYSLKLTLKNVNSRLDLQPISALQCPLGALSGLDMKTSQAIKNCLAIQEGMSRFSDEDHHQVNVLLTMNTR
jgi:hypothetical protein